MRHGPRNVEDRLMDVDDVWWGPCYLLGAIEADELHAEDLDGLDPDEMADWDETLTPLAIRTWYQRQRDCMDTHRVLVWSIQIEYWQERNLS